MAFKKREETKSFEIPTLIDCVFLLLIFFLIVISIPGDGGKGSESDLPDLPEALGTQRAEEEEILETLMIQIERRDRNDPLSPKVVYILKPDSDRPVTIDQARMRAKDKGCFAEFRPVPVSGTDRESTGRDPYDLIEKSIREFTVSSYFESKHPDHIEIRAARDTEFGIINFIMTQCSSYEDLLPLLIFRTKTEIETEREQVGF